MAMNGIDKITARIESDAEAEAARTAQEAASECARIRAEAEKQAQQRYWERMRQGMKSVEDRAARLAGTAGMQAKKTILAFKQETVSSVFDTARERLLSMPKAEYTHFLAAQAVAACTTGREELVFNAADRKAVAEKVLAAANKAMERAGKSAELTIADDTGRFAGGLIVRQGSIEINATVDALVEQARQSMAAEVAEMLFG